jgi:hypothetical protein
MYAKNDASIDWKVKTFCCVRHAASHKAVAAAAAAETALDRLLTQHQHRCDNDISQNGKRAECDVSRRTEPRAYHL